MDAVRARRGCAWYCSLIFSQDFHRLPKDIKTLQMLVKMCDYWIINLKIRASTVFNESFQKSVQAGPVFCGMFFISPIPLTNGEIWGWIWRKDTCKSWQKLFCRVYQACLFPIHLYFQNSIHIVSKKKKKVKTLPYILPVDLMYSSVSLDQLQIDNCIRKWKNLVYVCVFKVQTAMLKSIMLKI